MEFKTVGKSKSSNVEVASIADRRKNKKTMSSAEFQTSVMKKRGVYVEKKIQDAEANTLQTKKKPPRRPQLGQKKFLASVLKILSKSSTGTQYPDTQEKDDAAKEKTRFNPQWKITNVTQSKTKQKTKFKSQVLNKDVLRSEQEQLIILQSKKYVAQTPSNYSAGSKNSAIKWSEVLNENEQPKRSQIRDILQNNIYSGVAEGVTKQVLQDKPKTEKKLRINDDPVTLASEIAEKDENKFYNLFVDLLETTISMYNVKTDHKNSNTSKTALEIDDSVPKELILTSHENLNHIPKCKRIDKVEKDIIEISENYPIDIKLSENKLQVPIKSKIKAKSFMYPKFQRKEKPILKSKSFEANKKNTRQSKQKALFNILKDQLQMDTLSFEEPESLYDALKVMARNKTRREKTIRFNKKIYNTKHPECIFQRQDIITIGRKMKNKTSKNVAPTSGSRTKKKYYRSFPSHHSLEVYEYDYEEQPERYTYHITPSISESNLGNDYSLINYSCSSTGSYS